MSQTIQYITNEEGKQVGVLLDLDTYRQLTTPEQDPELLTSLSSDELLALAESSLSPKTQAQLDNLLLRNQNEQLSTEEQQELDSLLTKIDNLNLIKTRARYTLANLTPQAS